MSSEISNYEEGVQRLAEGFFRLKDRDIPEGFNRHTKAWKAFANLRQLLLQRGVGDQWQIYIEAQFAYAPERDATKVSPFALCSATAWKKFQWRLAYRAKRGMGRVVKTETAVTRLSGNRHPEDFYQSAWNLAYYESQNFTPEEAFRCFPHQFSALFVIAHPGVWEVLHTIDPDRFGPAVKARYLRFKPLDSVKCDRYRERMAELYDDARKAVAADFRPRKSRKLHGRDDL